MELFFLCLKIFFVRILDVSLGTFRSVITLKGKIKEATIIGFFEVLVWFVVVQEALATDNQSLWIAISYSLGFAAGTYLGGIMSDKFIRVKLGVQVILSKKDDLIVKKLREQGFAVSVIDVKGQDNKYMLFIAVDSKKYDHLNKLIKTLDPNAFIVVNETKYVHNGYFAK